MDKEKVIKGLEKFRSDIKPFCGGKADWERFDAGLAMLKEQEEQIKNRDESLEKAREEIKWLRGMLKEQESVIKPNNEIKGTVEETRKEWPDEALPLSRNETRECPVDNSGRNKA